MRIPVEILIPRYKDHLFGAAFSVTQNQADAQDAVQNTFIRYHQASQAFDSEEHIRLWLFRTVYNQAKDIRKSFWKRNKVSLDEVVDAYYPAPSSHRDLFEAVLRLPEKQRSAMQLYYYEDYSIKEIAAILGCKEAAVKKRLSRARATLKQKLQEEWDENE
ncbi:RNA polymerase sigma factor [uncultured Dubosiella sp.]|uniref:RNA polymerase sigma factor n=1 Tax=uncultured Dubosiella sp. TaxID=1937011 RepID=UPI0025B603BC|nr:RNA polymerase sigma factor [uncultured Dubosiella sp.]